MAPTAPGFVGRTSSAERLNIRSPVPDANSLPEGATCKNVERLEQSAEELSQGGSDIGEEIRKLREEQRLSESRRSSLASDPFRPGSHNTHRHPLHTVSSKTRSRGASNSSYTNSIVDLNREARSGGYSLAGFMGSPAASIHSDSWSQPAVLHRSASSAMSITTRPEPVQEGRPLDSPLASLAAISPETPHACLTTTSCIENSMSPSRRSSQESKHSSVRSVSDELQVQVLDQPAVQGRVDGMQEPAYKSGKIEPDDLCQALAEHAAQTKCGAPSTERPGSTDTFNQANLLFQDFDGVHFSPANEEFVATDEQGNVVGRIPLKEANEALVQQEILNLLHPPRVIFAQPPPSDNMVFYPAPVPRILNLPKKLSTRPSSTVMAQRKSQAMLYQPRSNTRNTLRLEAMDFEHEDSHDLIEGHEDTAGAAYLGSSSPVRSTSPTKGPDPQQRSSMASLPRMSHLRQRSSMASLNRMSNLPLQRRSSMASLNRISNIPPQLRASVFFDHPAARQSVNIQSDSAVATLESILQASATAPVNVFTDHPFVGRAGADVYAKERPQHKRNTMSQPLVVDAKNNEKVVTDGSARQIRRSSASNLLDKRDSADDELKLPRRNSVMSLLTDLGNSEGKKLQKRGSRLSIGSRDLLKDESSVRVELQSPPTLLNGDAAHEDFPEEHFDAYDEDDEELQGPDMGPIYAQPTTLLAELQLRKAQQKSRNRTAATAFPNGMHATLLELDAVAQVESRKRKNHKVALAWEDPSEQIAREDESDEDVPLAVLYPTKNGLGRASKENEWDRPLGLMERRQMEDNEPLSRRRNRLLGINPRSTSRLNLSAELSPTGSCSPKPSRPSSQTVEDPDEDVPLAERRRRMKQKAALDSALGDVTRDSKSTLEAEILSVLGVPVADKPNDEAEKENTDETLGQRRARLQREKVKLKQPDLSDGVDGANGGSGRPALRQSMSLANLLGSVPLDPNSNRVDRRNISFPAPTSLLGQHESQTAQHKSQLRQHNARQTSYHDQVAHSDMHYPDGHFFDNQHPGQINSQGQVNGLISSAGGGITGRRTSSYLDTLQGSSLLPSGLEPHSMPAPRKVMPGLQAMQLQSKIQAGLAQQGQMMNPLAFTNFVPPAPSTGLGFNGGMAATPGTYGPMMPGYPLGVMQQTTSMPFGFMNGREHSSVAGYNSGISGLQGNVSMNISYGMGYGNAYNPMGMVPGAASGYSMMNADGMPPAQRDTIDRWRSSVDP